MNQVFDLFIQYIPRVVGAVMIIVIGVVVALVARRAIAWLLRRFGFDPLGERAGVTALLRRGNIQRRPSELAGTLVAYVVLILAILTALGALGLDFLAVTLNQVYLYAPRAFVGIVILFLGTACAGLLAEATKRGLTEAGVTRAGGLPAFVRYSVLFITMLLTATVLQIEVTILIVITVILLGGMVLTAVLALGLGLRDLSKNVSASRYVAEGLAEGDRITIAGHSGTIERIGYAVTTIRDDNDVLYLIPNAYFMEHIVAKRPSRMP